MAMKHNTKIIYTDGQNYKSVDPWSDDNPEAWNFASGAPEGDTTLYSTVAWIYRAVNLTANAVASMPWVLVKPNGDEYDSSVDWNNKTGILPDPNALLRIASMSLVLFGRAYLLKERNRVKVKSLRYLVPTTIEPKIDAVAGLVNFKRTAGALSTTFQPEDICYFWEPDPRVELGPPMAWRMKAMLAAGGLLYQQDKYASEFLARGGIYPTMLMVKGAPNDAARAQMESYWDKFIRGWFKVAGKIFNAEAIEPKQVGGGLKELKDQTLTQSARESICVAAGIPLSIMMSNAANYATSLSDRRAWYENTILPDCEFIAGVLNSQLWDGMGLQMQYRPETVDAFQEDENQRAAAYATYTGTGMKPSIAAQVVGLELPDGVEYEALDPDIDIEPEPEPEPEQEDETTEDATTEPEEEEPTPAPVRAAWADDLDRWQRKAANAVKKGKPAAVEFESVSIPAELAAQVCVTLSQAVTVDDVKAAFTSVSGYTAPAPVLPMSDDVKALLEGLRLGVEALRLAPEAEHETSTDQG